jgi:pimeloyl-ACP methyl ester carboxylesterase/DNA-binding CsgD family transcriptional regulator
VVDALGYERVDLLGLSGGGPVAVAYSVRHPERVSHLVLYGSYALGRAKRARSNAEREEELLVSMTRVGWGRSNPAFRRVFTTLFMPEATPAEVASFDELQRLSASPDMAASIRQASYEVDVTDLARRITVPTLVMHSRDDAVAPFEEGRRLAALIPGAQFVPLAGRNHILGVNDPAWRRFLAELRRFLAQASPAPDDRLPTLTTREREVLQLVADGLDNERIAKRLYVSVRTVERHLSNVYAKLGVSGRAARAAAAARFARHR